MERSVYIPRAAWWIGGALLIGAAFAGLHRALSFDVDLDIWEEAVHW